MNKNISSQPYAIIFILIVILLIVELTTRVNIDRGERFYIIREVTFKLPEVRNFDKKVDILCLGGSASNGMGLKNIKNRYSELLTSYFPKYNIINDSNTGIPLSEVNFYLYKSFKTNTVDTYVIFSGNNEYLELLNRSEHPNYITFLVRYSLPKVFSIVSFFSYATHNLVNNLYDKLSPSKYPHKFPFAIIKGGGKDSWPYLNKFHILVQNLFYRIRLLELRSIIKANPQTNFIYVIPPINYTHNWEHMKKYDQQNIEMPKDINSTRNMLEKYCIKRRFLITPKLQSMIKQKLKNLDNLNILDLDAYFLKQVNNNAMATQKFFLDYCHLNELGHSLLAKELKKIIENKNHLF